jgi:hypothetical protein
MQACTESTSAAAFCFVSDADVLDSVSGEMQVPIQQERPGEIQATQQEHDAMQATTQTQKQKSHPRRLTKNAILAQKESGMRWCLPCNKLLPPEMFRKDGRRAHTCLNHLRDCHRRNLLGTHEKRAFNAVRSRVRQDALLFGEQRVHISKKSVMTILSENQKENYTKYCLLPLRPDRPFNAQNAVVVTTAQRIYMVTKWKQSHNVDEYMNDIKLLIGDQIQADISA